MILKYVKGDATEPIGDGKKFIIHCCNDLGLWGAGFVLAISKKWKDPEIQYKSWFENQKNKFKLGSIQIVPVDNDISVVNMIGQSGVRNKSNPTPIKYDAIRKCLKQVAIAAKFNKASVHAPQFGSGLAGGDWGEIENIINEELIEKNIDVTIYLFD